MTRALSLCKQAVENSPKSAACLDSLGYVYYKLGLYDDANLKDWYDELLSEAYANMRIF